jgi:diaminopimelate decarboxylase
MSPAVEPTRSGGSGPVPQSLLPMSSAIGPDGRLRVGGMDVIELSEEYGTPLFVYDEAELRERCREAVSVWGDGVAYATKAFLCTAMAKLAVEEAMCLDVSTGGELHVARSAGAPAERLVLHGNNKTNEALATAISLGVGRIVVDSFDEIDRLERLLTKDPAAGPSSMPQSRARRPKVLARITPGVEVHTHEYIQTGQDDSKFGFGLSSGAARRAVERLSDLDAAGAAEFVGIHAHLGSQVFALAPFARAIELLAEFSAPLGLPELVVGGGLGVAYVNGEQAPTMAEWADSVRQACRHAGIAESVRVTAEPGRSIVAAAAVTLYRVGTVKDVSGHRTYVSVDGGMSDNPRPVLYGSGYEAFLPRQTDAARPMPIRLVGKHCETGDVVVSEGFVPGDLRVGDILATPVTGAYGHSMASNYNKVPRPAVVFVADGVARTVVRRETFEDLVRLDQ